MKLPFYSSNPYANLKVPKNKKSNCYKRGIHVHSTVFDWPFHHICLSDCLLKVNGDLTRTLKEGVLLKWGVDVKLAAAGTLMDAISHESLHLALTRTFDDSVSSQFQGIQAEVRQFLGEFI